MSTGPPTIHDLQTAMPDWFGATSAMFAEVWRAGDTRRLELCRVRIAQLLDVPAEQVHQSPGAADAVDRDMVEALAQWPTDDRFDDTDRACLALAEQFVIDAHGVTDEQMARVVEGLGDEGTFVLSTALGMFENWCRLLIVLGVDDATDDVFVTAFGGR